MHCERRIGGTIVYAVILAIAGCKRPAPSRAGRPSPNTPTTSPHNGLATTRLGPSSRPAVPPDLLPPGEYEAEVLDLNSTPRLRELSDRMIAAVRQRPEWWSQYLKDRVERGRPLPYHPNLGLSESEYRELLDLFDKQQLEVVDQFRFDILARDGWVSFEAASQKYEGLAHIEIDVALGRLQTPAGLAGPPAPLGPDATLRPFGPWDGVTWQRATGDLTRNGDSVMLSLGRVHGTGHVVMTYDLTIVDNGIVIRRDHVIFRFLPKSSVAGPG